ncbi:MAG: 2-oxoglutarate dehydrogenase complex dihydrolipoyllysine-residue succinyltransferase [Planctomycetia bacterium]|nr:2-oxoglutarate dehydrogenase complex dihydrolipoyllysine-residue succinyltransferase [Planctomycetia bacterium]
MAIELKVPAVGESISEVQIGQWLKGEGQSADKDENLVEIETDKATVEISAPVSGTISKVLKRTGETAAVGEVIGFMEPVAEGQATAAAKRDEQAAAAAQAQAAQTIQTPMKVRPEAAHRTAAPRPAAEPAPAVVDRAKPAAEPAAQGDQGLVISPEVPRAIPRGREMQKAKPKPPAPAPSPARDGREEEAVPMSPIRRRIAERLVEAQHAAALLTTFNEIDMSAVIALRNEQKQLFLEKYGIKLGFMSFFVKAAIDALKLVPQVNAEIRGADIVYHNYFDIGIAVGGGKGLVVPVLRDADRMSFAEIEMTIADLAHRARENSLQLEELQGGTFTISNGGVYGSMLSMPIVNPPQSGILGLHAIQDRPVARDNQVVIRPMMYVALTYDHRIVDGQGAVTCLKRIKEVIEQPMRMLVEI